MKGQKENIFLVYLGINSPQNSGFSYGLSYIGAVLKESGYNVSYFSLLGRPNIDHFLKSVEKIQPLLIGFSVTSSQYMYLNHLSAEVKKRSNTFIVCGGPHPTLVPESIKDLDSVDAYIMGEGEYPMRELAQTLESNTEYDKIKNLCFVNNGNLIKNEIRPLIEDLDSLPYPDIESHTNQAPGTMRFIFSRGCPFECSYCCNKAISEIYPNKSKYYRTRSPQSAIKEIKEAETKYQFQHIVFDDDCFTLNKKWFYEFINLYKTHFEYPFRCNIRVGTVNDEIAKLLKEAGASNIGIGIEHGNEDYRINILKKTITNKQIEETFALIKKYDISHSDFIMVGMPYETEKLFLDTVKLCRKISARGNISIFYPYPKTELGEICKQSNWLPEKNYYRERQEATINYPQFSKESIQHAAEAFPYFIENKKIPLRTPLPLVQSIYYFLMSSGNIFNYYILKLKNLFTLNRNL